MRQEAKVCKNKRIPLDMLLVYDSQCGLLKITGCTLAITSQLLGTYIAAAIELDRKAHKDYVLH
jgi:predicted RNA methylase